MSDDDLHRLLHDAVDDVHPEHGPDAIRARVRKKAPHRSTRRWAPLVVAAAAAVVLVIGGTAWLTNRVNDQQPAAAQPRPSTDREPSPNAQPPTSADADPTGAASTSPAPHSAEVSVFYVGEPNGRPVLFSERHDLDGVTGSDVDAAVLAALTGPPRDNDYLPFPAGDASQLVVQVSQSAGALTVDVQHWDQPTGSGTAAEQKMALQAVVWTADTATGTTLPVRFLLDGRPVASLLGTDTTDPVPPMPADTALSPVSITSPTPGETVPGTFTVTGQASDAEADVVWELKQDGRVVRHGFTTAQECCTLSPYSFTVSAPPGDYTLVVHDTDVSDGEGVGVTRDTKDITVG